MNTDNSPSNAENQKQKSNDVLLDEAMRERDTMPPQGLVSSTPTDHGWLEQFEAFGHKAFAELESVAGQGLTELESEVLIALAVKLCKLAKPGAEGITITYHGISPNSKEQSIDAIK